MYPSDSTHNLDGVNGGIRILVVDDMRPSTDSLAMLLQALGHQTCNAYNGEEALEKFASFQPEVVLLDLIMSGTTGFKTAEMMRNQFKDDKFTIVAMSGWTQTNVRQLALNAGCDAYLPKPTKLEDLNSILALVKAGDHSLANFRESPRES